jgi:hypothetical protein
MRWPPMDEPLSFGNLGLLSGAAAVGTFTLAAMKVSYGMIRDRIEELRQERDYYRDLVAPQFKHEPPPTDGDG